MLYVEKYPRLIADPITETVTKVQLKPANTITKKLWQAVESLRDIDNFLDDIVTMSKISKKRRRMKILATPLYSLYQSLRNVKNYFESEKEYKNHTRIFWHCFSPHESLS